MFLYPVPLGCNAVESPHAPAPIMMIRDSLEVAECIDARNVLVDCNIGTACWRPRARVLFHKVELGRDLSSHPKAMIILTLNRPIEALSTLRAIHATWTGPSTDIALHTGTCFRSRMHVNLQRLSTLLHVTQTLILVSQFVRQYIEEV